MDMTPTPLPESPPHLRLIQMRRRCLNLLVRCDASRCLPCRALTWAPGFTLQGGSVSSFSSSGTYIKIGRQVSIKLFIVFTSTSSASVDNITNFPFVAQNTSEQAVGSIRENAATGSQWHIRINNNNNEGLIRRYDNSASISNGFTFVGTLTYFTA